MNVQVKSAVPTQGCQAYSRWNKDDVDSLVDWIVCAMITCSWGCLAVLPWCESSLGLLIHACNPRLYHCDLLSVWYRLHIYHIPVLQLQLLSLPPPQWGRKFHSSGIQCLNVQTGNPSSGHPPSCLIFGLHTRWLILLSVWSREITGPVAYMGSRWSLSDSQPMLGQAVSCGGALWAHCFFRSASLCAQPRMNP